MAYTDAEANAEAITTLYATGHSTRDIATVLGHGKSTVNAVIVRHGGELRQKKGVGHPDYFDNITTPEQAYWLGFISADGCIITTPARPEGSHLSIQLAVRDKPHLVKLKKTLQANANVRTGTANGFGKPTTYASLAVGSRRLIEGLLALGVTPRKSKTLQPWDGPADLMPHYWRGMVDGDGSLAIKGNGVYTVFLCGSEATAFAFREWAVGICGTKATPYTHSGCWYMAVSGRYQVPVLVRALYENAPISLDRKQETADAILAADGPRKKPGPASRFATQEERDANQRKVHREAQRRYMQRKREKAAESAA